MAIGTDLALRALNRFGLGARVGERARIGRDARDWLRAQLDAGAPELAATDGLASFAEIGDALRARRALPASDEEARRQARRRLIAIAAAEGRAALGERISSERPYVERLVAFWSNHLCISAAAKVPLGPLAGSYERQAIRPHVLGHFEDMLLASARHPAMLVYLDNAQSIGPASPAARVTRRRGAERGLNENYARELLELHTLGVDGGYTQNDVIELARVLTGWTVVGLGDGRLARLLGGGSNSESDDAADDSAIRFAFVDQFHEPGVKTVLGVEYGASATPARRATSRPNSTGEAEGDAALRALARHPATHRFIAHKLVRHFVADAPPDDAVASVAQVFRDTDGDLRAVAAALVALPHAWQPEHRKFRTPQDWLVAVLRALDARTTNDALLVTLRQLRQPLWSPPSPKGYGDQTQEWADPDALLNRAELARRIARIVGRDAGAAGLDPRALLDVVDVPADDPLRAMLADTSIDAGERLSLALAGPAFQWR